ncbi:MAG: 4Fe-4S dicluster domain-containing protein [Candidatus Symbiothrix sp.]|nr:4Fe-4S dicluster domain-containing protein [Candidatus Symbiothrix sp.]
MVGSICRHKRGKNKIIYIVEDKCTGCQRCLRRCRYRVLDKISNAKFARVIVKHPNQCTACGDCLSACKFNALKLVKKTNNSI